MPGLLCQDSPLPDRNSPGQPEGFASPGFASLGFASPGFALPGSAPRQSCGRLWWSTAHRRREHSHSLKAERKRISSGGGGRRCYGKRFGCPGGAAAGCLPSCPLRARDGAANPSLGLAAVVKRDATHGQQPGNSNFKSVCKSCYGTSASPNPGQQRYCC